MDLLRFAPNTAAHPCHLVKAVVLVYQYFASRGIRKDLLRLAFLGYQV
jgi:hypothetical protein